VTVDDNDTNDWLVRWLTTVVVEVCLDRRRGRGAPAHAFRGGVLAPAEEALLADAVGVALVAGLETLAPDQRLAFLLDTLFAVPIDEIAPLVGGSPEEVELLTERARHRLRNAAS
jgi:DNA-directed RNA polymerase specialized sigma24 family protein